MPRREKNIILEIDLPKIVKTLFKEAQELHRTLQRYEEPYCEISQTDKNIKINIKMPAVKRRSISLKARNRKLEVKAISEKKNYYKLIDLPPLADIASARAVMAHDTLKLIIPYTRVL